MWQPQSFQPMDQPASSSGWTPQSFQPINQQSSLTANPQPSNTGGNTDNSWVDKYVVPLGQGAQAGLEGFGSVYDLARMPFNAMGANIPSATDIIRSHSPLPPPNGIASDLTRGTTSALASLGFGSGLAQAGSPLIAGIGEALTSNPAAQVGAFSGSEGARGLAQRAGAGPLGQLAAGFGGALAGGKLGGLADATEAAVQPAVQQTSADLRKNASQSYKEADALGGLLPQEKTNQFIDSMSGSITEPERVTNAFGKNPAQDVVDGIKKEFYDTPLTFDEAHAIDKRLGDAAWENVDPKTGKLTEVGKNLFDFQTSLRDSMKDEGGGFDKLGEARDQWAQSARLGDVERIIERAKMMENPSTALKTGFRQLYNNKSRMIGFNDAEKAAIKQASERGIVGDLFNTFGSKLGPLIAGGVGSVGGPVGAVGSAATAYGLSNLSRNLASKMQMNRAQNVIDTVLSRGGNQAAQMPQISYQPAVMNLLEKFNQNRASTQ